MLEVNKVRDEFENILKALEKRGISDIKNKLQDLIKLDDQRKSLKSEIDKINNESNIISKDIGIAFKSGKDEAIGISDELEKIKKNYNIQKPIIKNFIGAVSAGIIDLKSKQKSN